MSITASAPKLIAVAGPTGAGKSSFINMFCGSELKVGHNLRSCTTAIEVASCKLEGQTIVMIDTPGFDDSERSQADILKQIADYLEFSYGHGQKLTGLIYLHRISDDRFGGIARENFRLFSKICGDDAMRNVLIVTTMWEEVHQEVGERREGELMNKEIFFKGALNHGARMCRHHNTVLSARNTVRELLGLSPRVVQMQHEIVDECKDLPQTAAGEELQSELERQAKDYHQRMQDLQEEIDVALARKELLHQEDLQSLRNQLTAIEAKLLKVQGDVKKIKADTRRRDKMHGNLWGRFFREPDRRWPPVTYIPDRTCSIQ